MPEINMDWYNIIAYYFVPGMLILAILGVIIFQFSNSDASGGAGDVNVFHDLGNVMFNLGG